MPDLPALPAGVVTRTLQALIEAAPTILCGVLVAGILRRMVGADGVRTAFGAKGWRGIARGWAFGMLLPVCSIGVIPVARELRRCGVAGGSVMGFVLAAPLLNPISFLYGLTLSEPVFILAFSAASLVLALALGELWEYLDPTEAVTVPAGDEPLPAPGPKRLLAVVVTAARETVGPTMLFCLVGVVGSGAIAAALPMGSLQAAMKYPDPLAPVGMAALALPAFNSPLNGMMKVGLMFDHGNSVAAAFVLFVLGLGGNVGLVCWVAGLYGPRRAGVWFGSLVAAAVVVGGLLQIALPGLPRYEDHTHAFDEFSNPYPADARVSFESVREKVLQKAEALEVVALPALAGFALLGGLDRLVRRRADVDGWLARGNDRTAGRYDLDLPRPVVGVAAIVGLVVFSGAGAFMYYPARKPAMDELVRLRADAFASMAAAKGTGPNADRERMRAVRVLEDTDLAARKLMVGVYIREYRLTPEQEESAGELREQLEHVRDALLAGKADEAYGMRAELDAAFRACRAAYAGPE